MTTDLLFNRFARVERNLREEHPDAQDLLFVAVFCNGCGEKAVAPNLEALAGETEGWSLSDEFGGDDYCPRCR